MKKQTWQLYILYKFDRIVYVGISTNGDRRRREHLENKDYDVFRNWKQYNTEAEARAAERLLIEFLTEVCQLPLLNIQHCKQSPEQKEYLSQFGDEWSVLKVHTI